MLKDELRLEAWVRVMSTSPVNHKVCDTWPVRHQTYGHLSSLRESLPFDQYQVILLDDRGTQV